jgi:primosomal protein N' (replication factor Y)
VATASDARVQGAFALEGVDDAPVVDSPAAPVEKRVVASVVIDSLLPQLDRLFDYRVPELLAGQIVPGIRVKVPLRSAGRLTDGYVVSVGDSGGYSGVLSDVEAVVSTIPVLSPEVWALARKASERAAGNASDILRVAIPKRQVRVEKAFLAREDVPELVDVAPTVDPIQGYGAGTLENAIASGGRLAVDAIPLVTEVANGVWVGEWAVTMAAAAAATVARGESAILAVPDYRDQAQLSAALHAILPAERIVALDAKQSDPDRYRAFLRCLSDDALVVIGNRSVVYAPARRLGLIALWDDGDPLHSEQLSPYVHARDAALLRQEQQGSALFFFGHSRSTEVERLVEIGWLTSVAPTPSILPKVIPTAQQGSEDRFAAQARIPTSAWREAKAGLENGPVLVQVSRPGYAPRLACADCRQSARCNRCEGPLGKKSASATPACGWCGALAVNWKCSHCEGEKLRLVGASAGRTAEDLGRAFPGVRILIADGERPILEVGPEPALVIATRGAEPIAAGGYRAVLLLDGESMVARESMRVGEDCLRWWSNAAALAAHRAPVVLVGVGGALASSLATWRQADYARGELADRRALRFPPAVRVATITGAIQAVADAVATVPVDGPDILGPVEIGEGLVRTIVRFDYAHGAEIAGGLRAEVIRNAADRRKAAAGRGSRGPLAPTLRVRLDDVEPFAEQ